MKSVVVESFFDKVKKQDSLQKKFLKSWSLKEDEIIEFEVFLKFYRDSFGKSIDELVDDYLFLNKMVAEETYFFIHNGKYRYDRVKDVEKNVYHNHEYMKKYMVGLSISQFLWQSHHEVMRFFKKSLKNFSGKYLEIGPGGGHFLLKAIKSSNFCIIEACDMSETSVELSNQMLRFLKLDDKCKVVCRNFFDYDNLEKYDTIVMGEVLEHVENPLLLLKKVRDLLPENGFSFITTVINSPMIDHIYLFYTMEDVLDMVKNAGFKVDDYICSAAGGIPLERAIRKKMAIEIAMVLRR